MDDDEFNYLSIERQLALHAEYERLARAKERALKAQLRANAAEQRWLMAKAKAKSLANGPK